MSFEPIKYTLYLRTDKIKKSGEMPLYIRFPRIGRYEPKFSMNISTLPENWDSEKQCLLVHNLDIHLQKNLARINNLLDKAFLNEETLTIDMLKEIVSQRKDNAKNPDKLSFYKLFEEYVNSSFQDARLSQSTVNGYETTLRSLKAFRKELYVSELNGQFINKFKEFLVKRGQEKGKGQVSGTLFNRLKHIRAVINYITRLDIKTSIDSKSIKLPKDMVNDTFLERDEVVRLYNLIKYNKLKKDTSEYSILLLFLFGCFTGIRFGDLLNLKWSNLDLDYDNTKGFYEVTYHMQKMKKTHSVPLFDAASDVVVSLAGIDFEKVQNENLMFHTYSRTYINNTIRKLAKMANIDKYLTFHASRRTFATLLKEDRIPVETISKILGHTSIKMTERYLKTTKSMMSKVTSEVKLLGNKKLKHRKSIH